MPQRKNDIPLSPEELIALATELEITYRGYIYSGQQFTGTKELALYGSLREEILRFGGVQISTSTLRNIMTLKHTKPFRSDIIGALKKYINAFRFGISPNMTGSQKIFWGVNQGLPPGAFIEEITGTFIDWGTFKKELEERVITQCPRIIPPKATVSLESFCGKENWVIHILDIEGKQIGSIWIGGNPMKNWEQDGLVRIGKTISDTEWRVYQILARFPDGSYRIVKSFV